MRRAVRRPTSPRCSKKNNKKAPQAQKKREAPIPPSVVRSRSPAREKRWSLAKASEVKRSAPPEVGGADAILRERGRQPGHEVTGERHRAKQAGRRNGSLSQKRTLARPVAPTPSASALEPGELHWTLHLATRDNGAARVKGAVRPPGAGTARRCLAHRQRAARPLEIAQGHCPWPGYGF